ncbi:MAG TPA: outer membrane beta-barrel protein [Vicinamibacterales bacterium]|jgi:hypothetical protein
MMKTTSVWIWMAVLCLLGGTANAQTVGAPDTKYFVDINAGGQFLHHDVNDTLTFPLYDETATVVGLSRSSNGFFFEAGAGYKFKPSLAGAISFSNFMSKADAAVTASIPHPLFFDQPLIVNTTATDMARSERDVHLKVVYFVPYNDKIDVALSAGPSIVKVTQDFPSGSVAQGTQNLTVTSSTEAKTGVGFNLGFDGTYLVTPKVGVAIVVHYIYSSVDLTSATGIKAGGIQAGLGLHYRF